MATSVSVLTLRPSDRASSNANTTLLERRRKRCVCLTACPSFASCARLRGPPRPESKKRPPSCETRAARSYRQSLETTKTYLRQRTGARQIKPLQRVGRAAPARLAARSRRSAARKSGLRNHGRWRAPSPQRPLPCRRTRVTVKEMPAALQYLRCRDAARRGEGGARRRRHRRNRRRLAFFTWCFAAMRRKLRLLRSALRAIGSCATKPTKPGGRSAMSGPLFLGSIGSRRGDGRHWRRCCHKIDD
jgi:hypothetical protein